MTKKKKKKDILVDREGMYRLFENECGEIYIGVMCGGFASYEMKIKLNHEELTAYQNEGKKSLDKLALDVAHNSDSYEHRSI